MRILVVTPAQIDHFPDEQPLEPQNIVSRMVAVQIVTGNPATTHLAEPTCAFPDFAT